MCNRYTKESPLDVSWDVLGLDMFYKGYRPFWSHFERIPHRSHSLGGFPYLQLCERIIILIIGTYGQQGVALATFSHVQRCFVVFCKNAYAN